MVLDGGKGSGRRKENAQAVRDNWDRIFGNKKDTPMIDDDNEDYTNDDIDDFDDTCTWCGGCGEGDYDGASCRKCHGTGVEPREGDCDDHDFID